MKTRFGITVVVVLALSMLLGACAPRRPQLPPHPRSLRRPWWCQRPSSCNRRLSSNPPRYRNQGSSRKDFRVGSQEPW